MNPLVSVIVTTYHGEDTIGRSVQSIINQSYSNLEIIVVDDNGLGTHEQKMTKKELEKYHDERIVYIAHNNNKNGSFARNTGIHAAKGKYVALLDDDDVFRSDKIKKQVEVMENLNDEYAICYTGMLVHFQNGNMKEEIQFNNGYIFTQVIMRQIHAPSSVLMFKREQAISIGGFDPSFKRHQDWEFFDRMSYRYKVAVVPSVCMDRYIYKRNSAVNAEQYEKNRIYYLSRMKEYFEYLDEDEKKIIYNFHYQSICKEYIKNRKFVRALKYLMKCDNPLCTINKLFDDFKNSIKA